LKREDFDIFFLSALIARDAPPKVSQAVDKAADKHFLPLPANLHDPERHSGGYSKRRERAMRQRRMDEYILDNTSKLVYGRPWKREALPLKNMVLFR
jgi:hypothetical protein